MLHQDAWLCLLVWCKACHHQAPADLQDTSAPASARSAKRDAAGANLSKLQLD
jgi:hypothetical protein